jgi:hypothetical protein
VAPPAPAASQHRCQVRLERLEEPPEVAEGASVTRGFSFRLKISRVSTHLTRERLNLSAVRSRISRVSVHLTRERLNLSTVRLRISRVSAHLTRERLNLSTVRLRISRVSVHRVVQESRRGEAGQEKRGVAFGHAPDDFGKRDDYSMSGDAGAFGFLDLGFFTGLPSASTSRIRG